MNTKYGKLTNGQVEYAPDALTVDGALKVNPSAESYLARPYEAGDFASEIWLLWAIPSLRSALKSVNAFSAVMPGGRSSSPRSRKCAGERAWYSMPVRRVAAQTACGRAHEPRSGEVAARRRADKWVLVKTWLEEKAYYDFYLAAQDFAEDYPLFQEGLAALKRYANLTDETVEAILAQCVAD